MTKSSGRGSELSEAEDSPLQVALQDSPKLPALFGWISWNADFQVVDSNLRALEIFEYSPGQATGVLLTQLVQPDDKDQFVHDIHARAPSSGVRHSHLTMGHRRVTCDWYHTVRTGPFGAFLGGESTFINMTERLHQTEELAQAQKMKALSSLASGMTHDMTNVLAVILGFGSLVDVELEPGPAKTDVSKILAAAHRGKSIIRNLQGLANQQAGEMSRLSLNKAIAETASLLRQTISNTIRIDTRLHATPDTILADSDQLHTALMNVCVNAVHAIASEGQITLSTHCEATDESIVVVTVSDNGCGMNGDVLVRAIEPFFTTKDPNTNTGLGLSTVYQTIRNHGGTLQITSTLGEGTQVVFRLPSAPALPLPQPPPSQTPTPADATQHQVLLIDDESFVGKSASRMLSFSGYPTTFAQGGQAGLDLLTAQPNAFDLILLDLTMPQMDGVTCLKHIRSINRDIPVLICTGMASLAIAPQLVQLGVAGVLTKPLTLDELVAAVEVVLQA